MFSHSIIIREIDDVFCNVENFEVKIINRFNIKDFIDIYEEYKDKANIIIDSRLIEIIIYGILLYNNEIYVYDVKNTKIINIFDWLKSFLHINQYILNMLFVKQICFLFLFTQFYMSNSHISWNNTLAMKSIMNSKLNYITVDYIINYINIPINSEEIDFNILNNLQTEIINIFKLNNLELIKPLQETYTKETIQQILKHISYTGLSLNIN